MISVHLLWMVQLVWQQTLKCAVKTGRRCTVFFFFGSVLFIINTRLQFHKVHQNSFSFIQMSLDAFCLLSVASDYFIPESELCGFYSFFLCCFSVSFSVFLLLFLFLSLFLQVATNKKSFTLYRRLTAANKHVSYEFSIDNQIWWIFLFRIIHIHRVHWRRFDVVVCCFSYAKRWVSRHQNRPRFHLVRLHSPLWLVFIRLGRLNGVRRLTVCVEPNKWCHMKTDHFSHFIRTVSTHTHARNYAGISFKPSHLHGKQWAHIVRVRHRRLIIAMNVPSKLLFFSPTWAKNDRILFQRARTIEWLSMRMNMRQNTF